MGRRFAIAAAFVAVVIGVSVVLYRGLFGETPQPRAVTPVQAAQVSPPTQADASEREPEPVPATILEIDGAVDRLVDGTWTPVVAGENVSPTDVIRTRVDGRAVLEIEGVTIELDSVSQISQIVATRLEIARGRVVASVPNGRAGGFGVAVAGADAVAESEDGQFAVLADGRGGATVASVEGSVRVTARGETVDVSEGRLSRVRPGASPSEPAPIPASLFLKVKRPKSRVQRSKQLALSGRTAPGAVLSINGKRVVVDELGRFSTVVQLGEGGNRVVVRSSDVMGRNKSSELGVSVDTRGPDVGGVVTWGDGDP